MPNLTSASQCPALQDLLPNCALVATGPLRWDLVEMRRPAEGDSVYAIIKGCDRPQFTLGVYRSGRINDSS